MRKRILLCHAEETAGEPEKQMLLFGSLSERWCQESQEGTRLATFYVFSVPIMAFSSNYRIIWTGEESENVCLAACVQRTAGKQPSKGTLMGPNWRQKHTGVKRNVKCSPTACVQAKSLLTFSRPLENLKHWKIIFCRINKEASSQMGIFLETDFKQLLKTMFFWKL